MTSPFNAPGGGGSWLKPADLNGHLIVVTKVHSLDTEHFDSFKNGNVTKVEFDYVDLDDPGQQVVENALDTHSGIVGRLREFTGRPEALVLGRIVQVPTKSGNLAWIIEDCTGNPADVARAMQWLNAWRAGSFAAPAPAPVAQTVTPQPAPVVAPAAAPQVNGMAIPDGLDPATAELVRQALANQKQPA
jgi:hypothetical protein